jgi:hypothetical protein
MNKTTQALLQELALTGRAVITFSRQREVEAASALIEAGICYEMAVTDLCYILKFGASRVAVNAQSTTI